jgi:uncharacterized protein
MRSVVAVVLVIVAALGALAFTTAKRPDDAAKVSHRVVFELTNDDPAAWARLMNNIENGPKALGPTTVEVIVHANGLSLLMSARNAAIRERLQQSVDRGVVFSACENTMKKQNVTKADLSPFARTVDSAVAELVRKQEAGWSYLRVAP